MNEPPSSPGAGQYSQDQVNSALFAQLVLQQSNMAMMLLGKVAHPDSGKTVRDLEAARLFIDQLEMLEVKTRGNLSKEESNLLKQSLMTLRLAFVEAAGEPEPGSPEPKAPQAEPQKQAAEPGVAGSGGAASTPDEEHRKKFSKKY